MRRFATGEPRPVSMLAPGEEWPFRAEARRLNGQPCRKRPNGLRPPPHGEYDGGIETAWKSEEGRL
jgi:hypothetical protein